MRRIAQTELCFNEMKAFNECCKKEQLLMGFKCKPENQAMQDCLIGWFKNEEFRQRCRRFIWKNARNIGEPDSPKKCASLSNSETRAKLSWKTSRWKREEPGTLKSQPLLVFYFIYFHIFPGLRLR